MDDVAVVWLTEDRAPAEGDATRALVEWARARGLRLVGVDEAGATTSLRVDPTIADRVEKELARAHEAIAGLDADAAERALARAEALLRDHPELPQAAWLRAEVERSWAARFARVDPRDEARAAAAWRTAHALDGGRVAGVGETDVGPRKRSPMSIVVEGSHLSSVTVRLDGVDIARSADSSDTRAVFNAEASAAEHQLVAYVDGEAVFAQWVGIAEGGATAPIAIHLANAAGTCTRDAFAGVARDGSNIRATGVTCPTWAAAVPSDHAGAVLVARCERDACGPLLEWRVERWTDSGAPQPFARAKPWPAWATWTLIGIGAATATAITLVATGVFDQRPVEQRFVAGGARVE